MWLLVCCLYKDVYLQIFKCVSFWLHGCCGEWEGGPVNQVNHTSWVAVATPTDRPKSVRNCCLIELFVALFVLSLCPFDISVGVGTFVIGLSQISSFLLIHVTAHKCAGGPLWKYHTICTNMTWSCILLMLDLQSIDFRLLFWVYHKTGYSKLPRFVIL